MLPSDPQERQDGWYHVRFEGTTKRDWSVAWWDKRDKEWIAGKGIHEVPVLVEEIGPRILSPDEAAPAPIERPEDIARAIGMLERNRASLVFEGKPEVLAHFLELAIKWGLALEAEVARLSADKERLANATR